MSMLDIHRSALESVNEPYHNFLARYQRRAKIVYGFVEGRSDPAVYRSLIERFLPEGWSVDLLAAGSKNKVIEALENVSKKNLPTGQIAFFVDRDLSEFMEGEIPDFPNLYTTDGYSIENSIVNAEVAIVLLSEIYNIIDFSPDEKASIVSAFSEDLTEFQEFMAPMMAQIISWRRLKLRANLDNLNLPPMFRFENGRLKVEDVYNELTARLEHLSSGVGARRCEIIVVSSIEDEFRKANGCSKFVRGKYLIWFLHSFILNMHKSIQSYVGAYRSPPKAKVTLGPSNLLVFAGPRARTPRSFQEFLKRTYIKHISDFDTAEA